MKKLNILLVVATLGLGGCQNSVVEDPKESVEKETQVSSDEEVVKKIKSTYYDSNLFTLNGLDDYFDTDTIRTANELFGQDKKDVVNEETNEDSSSNNGLTSNEDSSSNNGLTSNGGSSSNNGSTSNGGSSSNNGSTSNGGSLSNNGSTSNGGSLSNNGSTSQPSQPTTPPVVEESKPRPVDVLDWNYIKSTLIANGESLGMIYQPSMNRELDGWDFPYDSTMDRVTNQEVIDYIGYQMQECVNAGRLYFNIEMVVKADGNVLVYLIR